MDSSAHPVSYPMRTGECFLGLKRTGHEAEQSPQASAEIKKDEAISPIPHTSSWRSA
jgi:hypothetical protein